MPSASHPRSLAAHHPKSAGAVDQAGDGQDTLGKTPGKTPERILGLLRDAPELSIPELAERLGKSVSAVERAIRKLREAGRLARVGPDKGGYWKVTDGAGQPENWFSGIVPP